jgi:DNA-binding response OmpR family regulator
VNVARDGSSALFIARSMRPDFVLLDIGLPGADGFQVAAALRREPGLAGSVHRPGRKTAARPISE